MLNADELLAKRTERLARRTQQAAQRKDEVEIALLGLADATVGIESRWIWEIKRSTTSTRFPGLPRWMPGIVQVRGQLITVVSLAAWLELPAEVSEDFMTCIATQRGSWALLSERVLGFEWLGATQLSRLTSEDSIPVKLLSGRVVSLLNVERMASDPRLTVG